MSRRIGHGSALSAKAHESAVRILSNIRDRVIRGEKASAASNVVLVCCGVSVERRRLLTSERDELHDDLLRTSVLIFVTTCLVEHYRRGGMAEDEIDRHLETLKRAKSASLWRRIADAYAETPAVATQSSDSPEVAVLDPSTPAVGGLRPWQEIIDEAEAEKENRPPPDDGDVAFAALCSGVMLLGSEDIETFENLSSVFYRYTTQKLASSALNKAGKCDFLSLSASAFCGGVSNTASNSRLRALISAGESEAGQQIMRDMLLSFLLPAAVVGVRQTLLLSRSAAALATTQYTEIVQFAHETAMEGLEWTWDNSTSPIKLLCALLTAVACLTTREGDDPIRKADAFGGHVQLPFLHTKSPDDSQLRVALVPESKKWFLFKLRNGQAEVQASVEGFEGAKIALLGLAEGL